MKIDLTTFFSSLGITGGNTQATNFYDFWYGIEFSGGTITYNITEFMTYLGTNRYEFFHSLQSTYPDVWDEYTFYSNIDDPRIYDFSTFYTYAAEYFATTPSSFAFNYAEFAIPDCSQSSPPNTFYCSNEYPVVGDIIYSDSSLTTPFVGLGGGGLAYYTFNIEGSTNIYSCEIDTDGTILTISYCANYFYEICLASTAEDACDYPTSCSDFGYYYFYNSSPQVGDRVYYDGGGYITPVSYAGQILYFGIDTLGKVYEFDGDTAVILSVNDCVSPTPTPTPTSTATPTPTPTNTPTPTPSPTIQSTYIGETRSTTNALSYTFPSQSYGGAGYIVVAIASTSTIQQSPSITSVSIAGKAATNLYTPTTATLSPGFWAVRLTGGTSGDIVVNYSVAQLGCSIAIYRIQNNISDTYNQRTGASLNSGNGTTLTKTFASNVNSNDIVLALAITDNAASTETWTRPTENASRVNETIRSSYASEKQTITGSYTATVEFSAEPTTRASLTMITIR